MTWLAICNLVEQAAANNKGLAATGPVDDKLLPRGRFIGETEARDHHSARVHLLQFQADSQWQLGFDLTLEADGAVSLEITLAGSPPMTLRTPIDPQGHSDPKRITYAWDAPERQAVLIVENLNDTTVFSVSHSAPLPLPAADICAMAEASTTRRNDPALLFFGIADSAQELAPMPALAGPTPIATAEGWQPIQSLVAGDVVRTRDGGAQPIRRIVHSEVPALGSFAPLRMRAPFFDLSQDILIAPFQKLLADGDMVEYLFGEEEVLVEARHLLGGSSVVRETQLRSIRYYQLLLDRHEILNIAGAAMESFYVPDPAVAIQHPPIQTPHKEPARPVLRPYEALTLRSVWHQ